MTDTFEQTDKYLYLMREKILKLESRELNFDFYLFFNNTTDSFVQESIERLAQVYIN